VTKLCSYTSNMSRFVNQALVIQSFVDCTQYLHDSRATDSEALLESAVMISKCYVHIQEGCEALSFL
jgi:hypothetical protein